MCRAMKAASLPTPLTMEDASDWVVGADGQVKLLDLGIAKLAADPEPGRRRLMDPTVAPSGGATILRPLRRWQPWSGKSGHLRTS